jgi:hypothetical protein
MYSGGRAAVEKIQAAYPASHKELHEVIASAILGMDARKRVQRVEGRKTNITTLFARLDGAVDVKAALTGQKVCIT